MTAELLKFVTPILLTVVGYFLIRLIVQLDRNTVACTELTAKLSGVTSSISALERDVKSTRRELSYQSDRLQAAISRISTIGIILNQEGSSIDPDWSVPSRHPENS